MTPAAPEIFLDTLAEVSIRWLEGFDIGHLKEIHAESFGVQTKGVTWQYSRSEALDAVYRGVGYIEPLPSILDDGTKARVGPKLDVSTLPWHLRKWV